MTADISNFKAEDFDNRQNNEKTDIFDSSVFFATENLIWKQTYPLHPSLL